MFKLPQEIEVWYIIPKIRSEFAKRLIKNDLSYENIGKILGITKASVTHYVKNKRANRIKMSRQIEREIDFSVNRIIKKESNFLIEVQRLLKIIKENKCSCDVCKKYNKNILEYCNCKPIY